MPAFLREATLERERQQFRLAQDAQAAAGDLDRSRRSGYTLGLRGPSATGLLLQAPCCSAGWCWIGHVSQRISHGMNLDSLVGIRSIWLDTTMNHCYSNTHRRLSPNWWFSVPGLRVALFLHKPRPRLRECLHILELDAPGGSFYSPELLLI